MSSQPQRPLAGRHIGRSWWPVHTIEDGCPCPQAPCGLVIADTADPACPDHSFGSGKSIREAHHAEDCQDRINGTGLYAPKGGHD